MLGGGRPRPCVGADGMLHIPILAAHHGDHAHLLCTGCEAEARVEGFGILEQAQEWTAMHECPEYARIAAFHGQTLRVN